MGLLRPKLLGIRRRARSAGSRARALVLLGVAVVFWLMVFGILFRMLHYFRGAEAIGEVLAAKLLALILLAFLAILLLSNVITALSTFFLARDLELLMAAPVDPLHVYGARLVETTIHSSWMVLLMLGPILAAYGVAYQGGALFVLVAAAALAGFFLIPAVAGSAVTLLLVNVFPARRARNFLAILGLLAAAGLILVIRLVRPEQIMRPEGFHSLVDFLAVLEAPGSVWLPSEWAAQAMMAPLRAGQPDWFPLLLLLSSAAALAVVGAWLHGRLFADGFSRAQEGGASRTAGAAAGPRRLERILQPLSPETRALVSKDMRAFVRDTTQWSQLILLAVLVVVYVYNIRVLPLFTGPDVGFLLVNVVSFLNLGLAGFVLSAIAARFLFPAVSLEGRTLWLLRSSPLVMRRLIWSKYWVNLIPLLLVALGLTAGTNHILRVEPFMMALSLVNITGMTVAIAALALGFGALFPRFDTPNAADVPTGFGGLLFMMTATAYLAAVIVFQAWPVYTLLSARAADLPPTPVEMGWLAAGLAGAAALTVVATAVPLRAAMRRAAEVEP
jgi:ABC-2 type transport system permease protein